MLHQAVLKIYYKDKYQKLHHEPQGKFFYMNGKAVFLADMNPKKWWRNYGGYSIAKQILESFSKLKIKVQIAYRVREQALIYFTNPSTFKKKGIFVSYGDHDQYVLPISNWSVEHQTIDDPKGLAEMDLSKWEKTVDEPYEETDIYITNPPNSQSVAHIVKNKIHSAKAFVPGGKQYSLF